MTVTTTIARANDNEFTGLRDRRTVDRSGRSPVEVTGSMTDEDDAVAGDRNLTTETATRGNGTEGSRGAGASTLFGPSTVVVGGTAAQYRREVTTSWVRLHR